MPDVPRMTREDAMQMKKFRLKWVMRADARLRMFRVARFIWERGVVGDGNGYSAKLSVALCPTLWSFFRDPNEWALRVLGVRLHYLRAYGGHIE